MVLRSLGVVLAGGEVVLGTALADNNCQLGEERNHRAGLEGVSWPEM